MDLEEKKRMIASELEKELSGRPITITFASPPVNGARLYLPGKDDGGAFGQEDGPSSEDAPPAVSDPLRREYSEEELLTEKEQARLLKAEEKDRRRNEKAYEKMRRDIQKRGFDTALLRELEDPADIYSLSDDDLRQIEAAVIINGDGYYSFTYPEDFADIRKEKIPKKTILIFIGFTVLTLVFFIILLNNILSVF